MPVVNSFKANFPGTNGYFLESELEAKYNEFVPVLLHGEEEIFHWYFDQEKLLNFIQKHQNVQAA